MTRDQWDKLSEKLLPCNPEHCGNIAAHVYHFDCCPASCREEVAAELRKLGEENAKLKAENESKIKWLAKCSYMGPYRDCPTHGESPALRAMEIEIARLKAGVK